MDVNGPDLSHALNATAWFYLAIFSIFALITVGVWIANRLAKILQVMNERMYSTEKRLGLVEKQVAVHEEKHENIQKQLILKPVRR
jgi:hypothetical protein